MAYTQLAGLPACHGLYAAFFPGILAILWGSSKQLATDPVAVVSLLTTSAQPPFAQMGTPEFATLAIMLALLIGLIQLALGLVSPGVIVDFLSHPAIIGFTSAAAIIIAVSLLNKICGISMAGFMEEAPIAKAMAATRLRRATPGQLPHLRSQTRTLPTSRPDRTWGPGLCAPGQALT